MPIYVAYNNIFVVLKITTLIKTKLKKNTNKSPLGSFYLYLRFDCAPYNLEEFFSKDLVSQRNFIIIIYML